MVQKKKISILIADSSPVFRAALKSLLEHWGFNVLGETANDSRTFASLRSLQPDVLLIDLYDIVDNHEAALSKIKKAAPGTKILVVSDCDGPYIEQYCIAHSISYFNKRYSDLEQMIRYLKKNTDDDVPYISTKAAS